MSTRKAPYKHADGSNCWTKDCRLGHVRNSDAKAETFENWIPATEVKVPTPEETTERLAKSLVRPDSDNTGWDGIESPLEYIQKWEEPWTEAEKANLAAVAKLETLAKKDPFTAKDEAKARAIIAKLVPFAERKRPYGGWTSNDTSWRARDKMLHTLAENILLRRLADDLPVVEREEATNDHLLGLREAQDAALKALNHADYYKDGESYMGNVEPHFQNAIARSAAGEELAYPDERSEDTRSLFPVHHRIFSALHPTQGNASANQLYLAAVFPVNELKVEMDRVGIDNVSVSPFYNTREWGNVYTVMAPDGSTRSFSVYEHRNTDSIIINGTENWNGKELPYATDSKQAFFAEFEPDDRERAAQALTFYMVQAQKGELEDPEALVDKVSRRDWAAILDNAIPGYKEWRQRDVNDTYIAPEQEDESDILKRLDF